MDINGDAIVGQLGDSLLNITPISVRTSTITKELVGFLPSTYLLQFGGIMDNIRASERIRQTGGNDDKNSEELHLKSIPTYFGNETHQAVLPVAIPLFFNHGLDGPYDINDETTCAALFSRLSELHPILADWISTMKYLHTHYQGHGIQDLNHLPEHQGLLMPITHPNMCTITIPVSYGAIANSSNLSTDIIAEFSTIIETNIIEWYERHKDNDEYKSLANQLHQINRGETSPSSTSPLLTVPSPPYANSTPSAIERAAD
jgi:hypothetical protein